MTLSKRFWALVLAGIISVCALELGERFSIPGVHGLSATVEAIVGRPLTPVSVAGVARRTVRRCAVGVYC
jgi:hypothetical protein